MENIEIINLIKWVSENRDEIAFSQIFDFLAPKIKAYFIKNNLISDQAEELTQEVLSTIWIKAKLFNPDKSKFITWAFTIARNKKIDFYRKNIKNKYDILLAGGQDHLKGKIFRVGHLGYINDRDIITVITAIGITLVEQNIISTDTAGKALKIASCHL